MKKKIKCRIETKTNGGRPTDVPEIPSNRWRTAVLFITGPTCTIINHCPRQKKRKIQKKKKNKQTILLVRKRVIIPLMFLRWLVTGRPFWLYPRHRSGKPTFYRGSITLRPSVTTRPDPGSDCRSHSLG